MSLKRERERKKKQEWNFSRWPWSLVIIGQSSFCIMRKKQKLQVTATYTAWDCTQSVLVITEQSMFYTRGGSRLEGLEAPMELIRLRGIKHTQATGSGGEGTDLCLGINQYSACSDKSSQLQWPTGPHTLAHKTILVRHVKTAKCYHCHESKYRDSKSLALADWTVWRIFKEREHGFI